MCAFDIGVHLSSSSCVDPIVYNCGDLLYALQCCQHTVGFTIARDVCKETLVFFFTGVGMT